MFFVLTSETIMAALCLIEYNGCSPCLECWLLSCFKKLKKKKTIFFVRYGLQRSAKLHGISICQYNDSRLY